jgi:hypothetical protein
LCFFPSKQFIGFHVQCELAVDHSPNGCGQLERILAEKAAAGHHADIPGWATALVQIHQTPKDATNESVLLPSKQAHYVPDDFLSRRRQADHENARSSPGTL